MGMVILGKRLNDSGQRIDFKVETVDDGVPECIANVNEPEEGRSFIIFYWFKLLGRVHVRR